MPFRNIENGEPRGAKSSAESPKTKESQKTCSALFNLFATDGLDPEHGVELGLSIASDGCAELE